MIMVVEYLLGQKDNDFVSSALVDLYGGIKANYDWYIRMTKN